MRQSKPGNETRKIVRMISLRFPPKELSPNARPHWAKLAKAKRSYRMECFIDAKRQGIKKLATQKPLTISLVFYPPDRRRRDWDNMLAAAKSGLDGLADALGVDDRNWKLSFSVSPEPLDRVSVEISA